MIKRFMQIDLQSMHNAYANALDFVHNNLKNKIDMIN